MTSANIQQWIQHPEMLDRNTLYELRNMLARYPYFQSLRLLYLKNLYLLHDSSFGSELRKSVLYVADRRMLFHLIEGQSMSFTSADDKAMMKISYKEEPNVDRTLALIDAFLATVPEETVTQKDFDYSIAYPAYSLEDVKTSEMQEEESPKLKGHELIDNFIEKNEEETALSKIETESEVDVAIVPESNEDTCEKEKSEEDDSCFTETLAKIYIKQRRYSKALEIIKKLSLKYPKKNAYFADQIRFLEKLIINANSK